MTTPAAQRELERAYIYSPFDVFARVILASREEVLAYSSQLLCQWAAVPRRHGRSVATPLEPIGLHDRGVCVGGSGQGQCDSDGGLRGRGRRCLVRTAHGGLPGCSTTCEPTTTAASEQRREAGQRDCQSMDARCQVCAVELNTDDNSRIEFNAPRDLIGFERHEHYVGTFYSPDWPYGQICAEPGNDDNCLPPFAWERANEAAANYANLASR